MPSLKIYFIKQKNSAGAQGNESGTVVPSGIQLGLGVKAGAIYRINTQGTMTQTNNPLDIGIQGAGYLQVTLPDGTIGYTRDGTLTLGPTGEICTQEGYPLATSITVPTNATAVTISTSGAVQATIPGHNRAIYARHFGTGQLSSIQTA